MCPSSTSAPTTGAKSKRRGTTSLGPSWTFAATGAQQLAATRTSVAPVVALLRCLLWMFFWLVTSIAPRNARTPRVSPASGRRQRHQHHGVVAAGRRPLTCGARAGQGRRGTRTTPQPTHSPQPTVRQEAPSLRSAATAWSSFRVSATRAVGPRWRLGSWGGMLLPWAAAATYRTTTACGASCAAAIPQQPRAARDGGHVARPTPAATVLAASSQRAANARACVPRSTSS